MKLTKSIRCCLAVLAGLILTISWSAQGAGAIVSRKYFMYAAVFEKTGGPCPKVRVVENKTGLDDRSPGVVRSEFSSAIRRKYKDTVSFDTYAILCVPTTVHAIVYAYTIKRPAANCEFEAIGVAEGATPESAERAMQSQLKLAGGINPRVVRTWPSGADLQ
ncbi:MAG: hypothetical protein K0Q55_2497 [Verrucomicrobia bacterium]|jgi:hypothetical protein|nr:hypothetical protein [Verrucomicrobiota bacterium]